MPNIRVTVQMTWRSGVFEVVDADTGQVYFAKSMFGGFPDDSYEALSRLVNGIIEVGVERAHSNGHS